MFNLIIKNNLLLARIFALFVLLLSLNSCSKSAADDFKINIQKGKMEVEIFALYTTGPMNGLAGASNLYIRYNNVLESAISLKLRIFFNNGSTHDLPITIPAGYRWLDKLEDKSYLNVYHY